MTRLPPKYRAAMLVWTLMLASAQMPAHAQSPNAANEAPPENVESDEVIDVTATTLFGAVETTVPVELELTSEDVAEFGVSSIAELLDALGATVSTGRGRSGGRPIVLLNGRRISGFRELRDLPPEAIARVQIFPEELALQYGFRPDQRVVNFILVPDFRAISVEVEHGFSTKGGTSTTEFDNTYTRISKKGRLNVDLEYELTSPLTEAERGIVQEREATVGLRSDGDFRTLIAETDRLQLNANWSYTLSPLTSFTLSGEYEHSVSAAGLGLVDLDVTVPSSSPFARLEEDEAIYRFLPAIGGLERGVTTDAGEAGFTLDTRIDDWRLNVIANYDRSDRTTVIDQDPDLSDLLARIAEGNAVTDPFTQTLGAGFARGQVETSVLNQGADVSGSIRGFALALPAGDVTVSATAGFDWQSIESIDDIQTTALTRRTSFGRATIDIPLTSRDDDVLAWAGDFSINGNAGYSHLSDFGGLFEYGYGLKWQPIDPVSLTVSLIGEEAAPGLGSLGNPLIITPNVSVFDFTTGQSVLVSTISGGNPELEKETRRDIKIALNVRPWEGKEHRFLVEYNKNKSTDVTNAFPLLTPEIEAAFPDRVIRSEDGTLVSVDQRPVTFSQVDSESLRMGFELRGRFEASGGRGGPGGGRGGPGGGRRGRGGWQVSLYHTYALSESVLIAPGIEPLDLLDGSVIASDTPLVRHSTELAARIFKNGKGLRVAADYTGFGRIDGASGDSDLFFNDLFTLDIRAFYNFDANTSLIEDIPFLKGSRASVRIDNIFGGIRNVTDGAGTVPIAAQPGYIDPRGRVFQIEFRKLF